MRFFLFHCARLSFIDLSRAQLIYRFANKYQTSFTQDDAFIPSEIMFGGRDWFHLEFIA
jgi:hypothetical protein